MSSRIGGMFKLENYALDRAATGSDYTVLQELNFCVYLNLILSLKNQNCTRFLALSQAILTLKKNDLE
jgi:hypothetical protein